MITKSLYHKISDYTVYQKWKWLTRLGFNNIKLNDIVHAANDAELCQLNIPVRALMLSSREYERLLEAPALANYRKLGFVHSKPLEYLTTASLLKLPVNAHVLDAAGGADGEYLRTLATYLPMPFQGYCQDAVLSCEKHTDIHWLGGSISAIPLPDNSLDGISCHHSFEHFRDDLDIKFIHEMLRLLKPGGSLVVTPLFLTNIYAEIWNIKPLKQYDSDATLVYDSTASFAGWGPYEGFARTYSIQAFQQRILSTLPKNCEACIYQVFIDGQTAPDIAQNAHQPHLNANMKALVITKQQSSH